MNGNISDFDTRKEGFLSEYSDLVSKYRCDFMSQPIFMPNNGTWDLIVEPEVVDITEPPVKSPFTV